MTQACLIASLLFSLTLFLQLNKGEFLKGPDAYYYALQADYWATTGEVKIPDSSIIHRLVGSLQKTGLRTGTALHVWITFAQAMLALLTLLFAKQRGVLPMTVVTVWLLLSPSVLFVAIEFPKLFLFLLCLPPALFLMQLPAPRNLYAVIPLFLAVVLHKAALPIAGLLVAILLLQNYHRLIFSKQGLGLLLVAFLAAGLLYTRLSDRLGLLDLDRLGGLADLSPGIVTLLGRDALPLVIKLELVLLLLALVWVMVWRIRQDGLDWSIAVVIALILPGFVPFSSLEVFGVGERYAILLPLLFILAMVYVLPTPQFDNKLKPWQGYGLLFAALMVAVPLRTDYSHPAHLDPDNRAYDTVTKQIGTYDIPMLIAHRGLNFYYKFKTHKESFHYEPEEHWDKTRIWRLSYRITADELGYYLPKECSWQSDRIKTTGHADYFLIREDCWFRFRQAITPEVDQDLYTRIYQWWRNPAQHRPAFLYRKHRASKQGTDDGFATFRD
ncbi:MAG: hypothetical protein OEZ39_08750 [Gammaproteobacteria bacterium]|nr:hypothetical protein [Gammaproteobacteria bacterium]MDH5651952.1 hypothetical protein [Gammaproteobacteria bacterium]